MAIGLQVWSKTAASNSNADTNINWAEGMAPSQVNDSARAGMASVALWRDDNNGSIVTAGSSTAYTATSNQIEGSLTAGYTIGVQFHATNDSSATLNVDSLGGKPMQIAAGFNLSGGEFPVGSIGKFTYSTTGSGQWIAQGFAQTAVGVTNGSSAISGYVGEYQASLITSGSAVTLNDGVPANITSLVLPAGDWDLCGEVILGSTNNYKIVAAAISQVTAETTATGFTVPIDGYAFARLNIQQIPTPGKPFTVSGLFTRVTATSNTTCYLNANADMNSGTGLGYGALRARRMR